MVDYVTLTTELYSFQISIKHVFTVKKKTIKEFSVEIKMQSNNKFICFFVVFHAIIFVSLGNFAAVTSTK